MRPAREARRRPQPRHMDRCQATTPAGCRKPGERAQHATNHGTRTGAKQHQPPSGWRSARPEGTQPLPATNRRRPDGPVRARQRTQPLPATKQPLSGWTSARPEGTQPLLPTNSHRPNGRVRARRVPSPCWLRTAAVRMDDCAPGGYPAPAGYEQTPSGRTSARPAAYPAPAGYETAVVRMDECAPGGYPAPAGYEQPPSGWTSARPEGTRPLPATYSRRLDGLSVRPAATPRTSNTAHATHSTTRRASTPVNRSQVAQDTAHPTQHTERAHR